MNKFNLAALTFLVGTNVALAAPLPCDGYKINVKNDLADNLLATTLKLSHAELNPSSIHKIESHKEELFLVNNTPEKTTMVGEFSFHTISVPVRDVKIKFELANRDGMWKFTPTKIDGDYHTTVVDTKNGLVNLTIVNR